MKPQEETHMISNNKRFKSEAYPLLYNKSRIYNHEYRKKPAELVRKDLISAMKLPDHELLNRDDYCIITDPWREEWEKGVQVPVNPNALPHSTIKNNDSSSSSSSNNSDNNENNLFILPKELIKSDPILNDHKSSYELDLLDVCWLQSLKASELELFLSQNFLEFIINKFEQQCAENIKTKQMGIEYDDHIVCDVCQSPDGEEGNEMVFCDSCNICVHQACYGIQEIPDGDWLCKPCKDLGSHKKNALCLLCPNVGGALKPTTKTNKWAHVSCVYWIPEAKFLNLDYLEPVEIKSIPNWRWNLVCSLCNIKKGAPIICDEKNCRHSYHVTCAFKHKLKMKIVLSDDKSNVRLKSYCVKHSQQLCQQNPNEPKNKNNKEIDFFDVPDSNDNNNNNNNGNQKQDKLNSRYEFWKYVDKNQIFQDILNNEDDEFSEIRKNVSSNQLNEIIDLIYQYWKLKRLSNYGNSLIKLTFAEKFKEQVNSRKNQMRSLRYHLERLRTLSYMLCRREKIKQNYIQTQKEILENTLKFVDDEIEKSSRLTNEHTKLFSSIINHHSLYSIKNDNHNNTLNMSNGDTTENNDNLNLMKEESVSSSSTATSSTMTTTTLSTSANRGRKTKSENSITNRLIREVKRLKKIQQSRNNPYARVYLYPIKSRKSLPNAMNNNQENNDEDTNENVKVGPKLIQPVEENNHINAKISTDNSSSSTSLLHLKPLSHNNNSKLPVPPSAVRRVNTIDNYFKKIESPINSSSGIKINKSTAKTEDTKDSSISQKENDNFNHLNSNSNNRKSPKKLLSPKTKKRKNSIHFKKSIVPYTLPTASNQHNNNNNDNDDKNGLYKIDGKYLKIQSGQIKLLSPSAAKKSNRKNNLHKHRHHHYKYDSINNNHKTFNGEGVCKNKIKYSLRNKV